MDQKALALLLLSLISLLLTFAYTFLNPMYNPFGTNPLTILVIIFFIFGAVGFGFLSFIPHAILGLSLGSQKNSIIFIYIIPIVIATYAGLKLGSILLDDFMNKKYFLEEIKPIIIMFAIAIIIAISIEALMPYIMNTQFWPEDFFGMKITEGENLANIFEQLKQA